MNLSRPIFAINIIISCLRKLLIKHILFTAFMNQLYMYIILKNVKWKDSVSSATRNSDRIFEVTDRFSIF